MSNTAKASKHSVVMDMADEQPFPEFVTFVAGPEELDEQMVLTALNWSDLGEPGQITVTVLAGDHLNNETTA